MTIYPGIHVANGPWIERVFKGWKTSLFQDWTEETACAEITACSIQAFARLAFTASVGRSGGVWLLLCMGMKGHFCSGPT